MEQRIEVTIVRSNPIDENKLIQARAIVALIRNLGLERIVYMMLK